MAEKGQFPTRENCDPNDPEEWALWMLVAWPGMRGGQLAMPIEYMRLVSKRLWDCGARPVEDPVIKYRAPSGNEPHWLTSPGRWVDINEPDPAPNPVRDAVAKLSPQQQAEVFRELKRVREESE